MWSAAYHSRTDFERNTPAHCSPSVAEGEAHEQFMAARSAAAAILATNAAGLEDVVVNISGHANPGHRPRGRVALDCIGVYVGQKARA